MVISGIVHESDVNVALKIKYANKKVEQFFTDYEKMKKKIPLDWVITIKKHMNHLIAADNFGIFLSVGLGHPEQLAGYKKPTYSLRVSRNVRMIFELNAEEDEIQICEELMMEGVCDYHGGKENWFIQ